MLLIPSLVRLFFVPFYSKDSRGRYSHRPIVLSEFWHWPWRYWHLNSCVVHTVEEDTYIARIIAFLSIGDNKFLYTCFSRFPTTEMFFFSCPSWISKTTSRSVGLHGWKVQCIRQLGKRLQELYQKICNFYSPKCTWVSANFHSWAWISNICKIMFLPSQYWW